MNVFKLLFMFGYFLSVKLCKFNVLDNPSNPQRYDRPHCSNVILNPKILRKYRPIVLNTRYNYVAYMALDIKITMVDSLFLLPHSSPHKQNTH